MAGRNYDPQPVGEGGRLDQKFDQNRRSHHRSRQRGRELYSAITGGWRNAAGPYSMPLRKFSNSVEVVTCEIGGVLRLRLFSQGFCVLTWRAHKMCKMRAGSTR